LFRDACDGAIRIALAAIRLRTADDERGHSAGTEASRISEVSVTGASALAWLNDLAQWFGRWFPRLVLIHPTHRGVRFGLKGAVKAVGPGLVVYWPIIHDLVQVPVTTISYQTTSQTLWLDSDDGGMVPTIAIVGNAVQFRVVDPIKAAVAVLHFHAIVDNRVQAAVAKHWRGDLKDRSWCDLAHAEAAESLLPYGIELQRLDPTSLGRGCALKNLADWSYSDNVDGKRPS